MLRVGNLQRSIKFYTEVLGMRHLRTSDQPDEEYTLVFMGFQTEKEGTVLELTYNYGKETYDHGGAYGHIAIGVDDVKAEVEKCKAMNVPIDYVSDDYFMAFIRDPDGYQIELLDDAKLVAQSERKSA